MRATPICLLAAVRWRSLVACAAVATSLLMAVCAGAGPKAGSAAERVLRRLIQNGRSVNMRGREVTMVMLPGGRSRVTTQRVVRRSDGRSLAVCTEPAWQAGVVTAEDGTWRRTWDPRRKRLVATRAVPRAHGRQAVDRMLRLILRNYEVTLKGVESWMGRKCYRVLFTPRQLVSHPVTTWVDVSNGAVLGHREDDWGTATIGLTFFATVEFPSRVPLSEVTLSVPASARKVCNSRSPLLRDIGALRRAAGFDVALPIWMPGGYEFEHGEVIQAQGSRAVCLHYTDGIANISIFERRTRTPRPPGFASTAVTSRGASDVVSVQHCSGPMEYVVIGHGEPAALADVARALDLTQEKATLQNLSRLYHVAPDELRRIRSMGLGVDIIAALLQISTRVHRPANSLAVLCRQGWSWQDVAERFGLAPGTVMPVLRPAGDR